MNRFSYIATIVHQKLEEKCPGFKKQEAYQHLYGVTMLCIQLADIQHLDTEIAATIGILHDYATYYLGTSFDHANRSAMLAKEIVENSQLFTQEEIECIYLAIQNHSFKESIHDEYSELIKDSDLWYQYLYEPHFIFTLSQEQRIQKIKEVLKK